MPQLAHSAGKRMSPVNNIIRSLMEVNTWW
jgi:hypothetical protein